MSIDGISTKFTESIRFVTTVHSIDLFSDRNGSKWAQTNIDCSTTHVPVLSIRLWVGWGGVGQATARQCMAGQGWVGWGRIYV